MTDEALVDNFLAHFGVKGMKWGVRNVDRASGESKPSLKSDLKILAGSKTEVQRRKNYANVSKNKANVAENRQQNRASTRKDNTPPKKSIGNGDGKVSADEAKAAAVQVGKVALKYGAPSAAVAVGAAVGLPAVAALGVSVRILQDPGVQDAISVGARFAKEMAPDMGSIKVPHVDMPKLENPFKVTTKVTSDGGSTNTPMKTREWMIKDGAGYKPVQWPVDKGFPPSYDRIIEMQQNGEIPK